MGTERTSYRLYNCARCAVQVRICSECDRGNQYCADGCAQICRRESLCRAGVRYQLSHRGAMRHAARQSAWRERRMQKVTHQGSVAGVDAAIVLVIDITNTEALHVAPRSLLPLAIAVVSLCSFCRLPLPAFTRLGPLRSGP
jgi:hypothetical protein